MSMSPGWQPAPNPALINALGWSHVPEIPASFIQFDGLVFATNNVAGRVMNPYSIVVKELDGWFDAPRDLTSAIEHWTGDGILDGQVKTGARTVTLKGFLHGVDVSAAQQAVEALSRLRYGRFVVSERGGVGAREVDARRIGRSFSRVTPEFHTFQLTLQASDPLRYSGSQVLTNGSNVLVNRGDSDAFPVLELTGPHGALTVTHPGGVFTFPALSSGRRLIDCRNGDVWNGSIRTFPALGGPWPFVPSGGATWTVSGLGAGTAVVKRFEAWS